MIFQRFFDKKLAVIGAIVVIGLIGIASYYYYVQSTRLSIDLPLQKAFTNTSSITTYDQVVETRAEFPDRSLAISGIYGVDTAKRSYSSYSTTTLTIHGDLQGHVFTHKNIAIGSDVYVKVETADKLLSASIKNGPMWQHFTATTIPHEFSSIAIPGPIQDNLSLMSDNGKWLTLIKKSGSEKLGSSTLLHYVFRLSGKGPNSEGALNAMILRITPTGTIDVWIDPATSMPRYLRFMNSTYVSTTTLQYTDPPTPIVAPIAGAPQS